MSMLEFKDKLNLTTTLNKKNSKHSAEVLKSVGDHFRNDINAVWQRSQFFLAANLTMLAFFYSTAFDRDNLPSVAVIALIGATLSILWLCLANVTIRWINVWRHTLIDVENEIFTLGPYKRGENLGGNDFHEKFRPEKFSPIVAFLFFCVWLIVLLGSYFHVWPTAPK